MPARLGRFPRGVPFTPVLVIHFPLVRATVGLGEIAEALSDRERAKTFASRIGQLITNAHKVDERVSLIILFWFPPLIAFS